MAEDFAPGLIDRRIDALVWEQAARTPDAVAATFGGRSLSYRELEAACGRAAARLRGQGVDRGTMVGIHLERSLDMLVALLATMRAGAAYIPLDPDFPPDRLQHMVSDSGLGFVVTQAVLADDAPAGGYRKLLVEDLVAAGGEGHPVAPGSGDGHDLAYVLYTSGSTGLPKGVAIEHRSVVNFLLSMQREPGIAAGDRLLAVTTLSFDIAGLELYLPLVAGATVVIATRDEAMDGEALRGLVETHGITFLQATPSSWRLLLEAGWEGAPGFKALCGGEPMPLDLAAALTARCGELWNMYGPTETTIWSTAWRVPADCRQVLVGRPIANTQVHIVDKSGRRVPAGIPGEICIGGDGVGRGYLNRPELTAERFVADPFAGTPDARLYRTGDQGRLLADGNLECRGRMDGQVKIRGYRIELGEIEQVLLAAPGVKRAVAVPREDVPGDLRLAGYVVADEGATLDEKALFEHLRAKLPGYMVPQHLVVLEAVPLLPNGKVDRKSLPPPPARQRPVAAEIPAEGSLERLVAVHMAEVLGIEVVGIDEDFFDLGGHSMLAVQLFHRLRRDTQVNLPLTRMLQASSPRDLAAVYREAGAMGRADANPIPAAKDDAVATEQPAARQVVATGGTGTDEEVPAAAQPPRAAAGDPWAPMLLLQKGTATDRPPLFLIHAVGGNVLNYRALTRKLAPSLTVYGIQALGLDGRTRPLASIEAMGHRYVQEILAVQPDGPYWIAGGSMGGLISYEVAQQLRLRGETVAFLGLFDTDSGLPEAGQTVRRPSRFVRYMSRLSLRRLIDSIVSRASRSWRRVKVGLIRILGAEVGHDYRYDEVHRVHYLAAERYKVRPYDGSIVVFRATDQPEECPEGPTLGWSGLVRDILVIDVPGSHEDLIEADELAVELNRILAPPAA